MLQTLTDTEKSLLIMIIQGENRYTISEWLEINYYTYNKMKKSLFTKLGVSHTPQFITALISKDISLDEI